jgi:putative transposase
MESTIGLYKTEIPAFRSNTGNPTGLREVERDAATWVHWYNTERIHSSIDNMPPVEREAMYSEVIARQGAVA